LLQQFLIYTRKIHPVRIVVKPLHLFYLFCCNKML
jgi:hypothetical protein